MHAMHERRKFARQTIQVAVRISTAVRGEGIGVMRDLSASGMLFHSRSRFDVGERISVAFRIHHHSESALGQVVRAFRDERDDTTFCYFTAIQFELPLFDLPV
jgi:hypothetical protein